MPSIVVKVAHHGSADQSDELYAQLDATVGIIGVGADNGYGHPTDRLLDLLARTGTATVRTDRSGTALLTASTTPASRLWTERADERVGARPVDLTARNRRHGWQHAQEPHRHGRRRRSRSSRGTRCGPRPSCSSSGPEDVLAERAITMLRDFLRAEDPALEVSDLEADGYRRGELLTLASPSLFGEPRLIRVSARRAGERRLPARRARLPRPAPPSPRRSCCATVAGMRGKKLLDAIRAGTGGGIEIVCAELKKDAEKQDFAAAEFRCGGPQDQPRRAACARRGVQRRPRANSRPRAGSCIADAPGDITEAVVAKYYGGRVETNAFAVADAAIAGRHGEALIALRHALDSGADPVPMVAAFAMKVRTMAKVVGRARRRAAARVLARPRAMAGRPRTARPRRAGPMRASRRAIEALAATDAAVKGAERDPVFALERLVGVIASRGRR